MTPQKAAHVPAAVTKVEWIRPFELEQPMDFFVAGKSKKVKQGFVVVVKVEPSLVEPQNVPDHLLYAGSAVAKRVNIGYRDSCVVALIPKCELVETPIFFGQRALPHRLQVQQVEQQMEQAQAAGIGPLSPKVLQAALLKKAPAAESRPALGSKLVAKDRNELYYQTVPLLLHYAPSEREMALSLRP